MIKCPFCGESLADELVISKEGPFDNTRDALIYIAKRHGVDTLLGKTLKDFFPDYAPLVPRAVKNLVFAVYTNGAAKILQDSIEAKQVEKELAFKKAVAKLTEAFITEQAATAIILEFTEALGWNITLNSATDIVAEFLSGKRSGLHFGNIGSKPITWRVLDIQKDKALMITEKVIEKRHYNEQSALVTWEACTLREYLNNDFLKNFHNDEKMRIAQTRIQNYDNPWCGSKGGNATDDKIFLLSIEEVIKYFGDSGQLNDRNRKNDFINTTYNKICSLSREEVIKYFSDSGQLNDKNRKDYISDQYNSDRKAVEFNGVSCLWWLRSPGYHYGLTYRAAHVTSGGVVSVLGESVSFTNCGVRPALWLKCEISNVLI